MNLFIYMFLASFLLNIVVIVLYCFISKENQKLFKELQNIKYKELAYLGRIYSLKGSLDAEKYKVDRLKEHRNCKHWDELRQAEIMQDEPSVPCCYCDNFSLWEIKDN